MIQMEHSQASDPAGTLRSEQPSYPGGACTVTEIAGQPIKRYLTMLDQKIAEYALAQGMTEAEAITIVGATMVLKDDQGNPKDELVVHIGKAGADPDHYGIEGFDLTPIDGPKDVVRINGHFVDNPRKFGSRIFVVGYAGGPFEELQQYTNEAMQNLANADIHLQLPDEL
jgi:hypothetical protein